MGCGYNRRVGDVEHGQALLRISSTTRDLRFRPRAERVTVAVADRLRRAWRTGLKTTAVSWFSALALDCMNAAPDVVLQILMVVGLGALVVGGALQGAGALLRGPLALAQWRRLQGPRGGDSVSILGRVAALRTLRSPSGEDVVAFRARWTRAGRGPEVERAEPFWLDDGQADPLLVQVEHLYLSDSLSGLMPGGPSLPVEALDFLPSIDVATDRRELLLRPGDRVLVTGWLSSEIDPSISTHFRGVPLRRVLRGTPEIPLTVRQQPPAAPGSDG